MSSFGNKLLGEFIWLVLNNIEQFTWLFLWYFLPLEVLYLFDFEAQGFGFFISALTLASN